MPLHPEHKRRRGRNYAMAAILLMLVALFFVVTIAKISNNIETKKAQQVGGEQ